MSMLYNVQLMKYAGEDGVSAYGVLMYVSMVFQAIFVGYSVGVAPIESYHLGAENRRELRGLLRRSLGLLAVCAACMFAAVNVSNNKKGRATLSMSFDITGVEQLNRIIAKIRNVEGVIDIERTAG